MRVFNAFTNSKNKENLSYKEFDDDELYEEFKKADEYLSFLREKRIGNLANDLSKCFAFPDGNAPNEDSPVKITSRNPNRFTKVEIKSERDPRDKESFCDSNVNDSLSSEEEDFLEEILERSKEISNLFSEDLSNEKQISLPLEDLDLLSELPKSNVLVETKREVSKPVAKKSTKKSTKKKPNKKPTNKKPVRK